MSCKSKQKNIKTITLGCRFNFYESEVAKSIINQINPDSDIVIINSCSVTHEAERQSKQAVRKAIRENKDAKIIVTGCAAKTSSDYFNSLDGVFSVIQNEEKDNIDIYKDIFNCNNDINIQENKDLFDDKSRAFLQIQNGCDNFCTYCIVPFTRGRSKSIHIDEILNRVGYLDKNGIKELVLSGIDITSYGKDLSNNSLELADVIKSILDKYPNQERIRISSIDPFGITDKLFDIITNEPRIMPHFHLSIQSGDNHVLKTMKRKHTRESVIEICNKIHNKRPDIVLGSDFIAGFPTETDLMFNNTLKLIDEANLSLMHIFPYSPRDKTIAASFVQLPKSLIIERAKILREKAESAKLKLFKNMVSSKVSGIIEKVDSEFSYGKTDSFIPFKIEKLMNVSSIVRNIKIIDFKKDVLICEV